MDGCCSGLPAMVQVQRRCKEPRHHWNARRTPTFRYHQQVVVVVALKHPPSEKKRSRLYDRHPTSNDTTHFAYLPRHESSTLFAIIFLIIAAAASAGATTVLAVVATGATATAATAGVTVTTTTATTASAAAAARAIGAAVVVARHPRRKSYRSTRRYPGRSI